jgi:hypothetical protein
LTDNEIEKLENFPLLPRLQSLYLNNNHISKIAVGISECLPKLETLILTNNRLVNLHDIDPLAEITTIQTLALIDNVITKKPHYRLYVIHKLPWLRLLDFKKIKTKVSLSSSSSTSSSCSAIRFTPFSRFFILFHEGSFSPPPHATPHASPPTLTSHSSRLLFPHPLLIFILCFANALLLGARRFSEDVWPTSQRVKEEERQKAKAT